MARTVLVCDSCGTLIEGPSDHNRPPIGSDHDLIKQAREAGWKVDDEHVFPRQDCCPNCKGIEVESCPAS